MGWATPHIAGLREGRRVTFRPRGSSMSPRIESGQRCTVAPVDPDELQVGDVVLCQVRGVQYLHLVKAIANGRFLIGNNRGRVNGWVGPERIYGRLVALG